MSVELKVTGGSGINTRYDILSDDKKVATLQRDGNRGLQVRSHYGEVIAKFKTIELTRQGLSKMVFPTESEVYYTLCERKYEYRKRKLQEKYAGKIATLATEALIDDNATSRATLIDLLAGIELLAGDRAGSTRRAENDGSHRATDEYFQDEKAPWGMDGQFPHPPGYDRKKR